MRVLILRKRALWMAAGVLAVLLAGFCFLRGAAVTATGRPGMPVPILMYHSIYDDPKHKNVFVLSPKVLEQDLKYLKDNGYQTVLIRDLVAYVEEGTPLPEKPVVLTFDDGYLNNMTQVLPLLEKYDMKAVISVVGEFTDIFSKTTDHDPRYSHMTWTDITAVEENGRVEIGNHSYYLHHNVKRQGAKKLRGESADGYKAMLRKDLGALQEALAEKSGVRPVTFTYPYGHISEESVEVLRELGFKASLSCFERMNYITKDPECLYALGRYNRASGISTQSFMKKALKE